VAEHASVSVLGGRSVLQCSARAAASEYCLLELRATQRCSSPVETVSDRDGAQPCVASQVYRPTNLVLISFHAPLAFIGYFTEK